MHNALYFNCHIVNYLTGDEHKGIVLFSGPDGVRDHRTLVEEQQWIGQGTASPESTANVKYLCRAPKENPPPEPRSARVGEVGWGVPKLTDYSNLKSGHQIQLKTFRNRVEERYTHRYQDPYYPPPQFEPGQPTHNHLPKSTPMTKAETTSEVVSNKPPLQSSASSSMMSWANESDHNKQSPP